MEGEETPEDASLFPVTVGEKLRGAREAQGVELGEIAARTRIPQRHLESIEKSDYSGLPSTTYALGFAKAYARAVGADEVAIAHDLRAELSMKWDRPAPQPAYEMDDPTRVPPSGLAWAGLAVALLVLIGVGLWYGTDWFRGSAPPGETIAAPTPSPLPTEQAKPAIPAGGQVTLTATDTVWLRVSDGAGNRLFEKEMAPGERYDVPPDADRPTVKTGRPDAVQVTLNGSNMPPLGAPQETVEVEVSAAALRARAAGEPYPAPTATPTAGNSTAAP